MKVCPRCGVLKELEEFAKSGHLIYCKPCKQEYDREYYAKTKEKRVERKRSNAKNIRERNRLFIIKYLQNHPCIDCGESDIVVLHFDHLSHKTKEVCDMVGNCCSIEHLQIEINKCVIRCANCHMRKTAKDFNWFKLTVS